MLPLSVLQNIKEWPQRGGANGSIRFYPEQQHGANAGAPLFYVRELGGSLPQSGICCSSSLVC